MSRRTPHVKPVPAKPSIESQIAQQKEAFELLASDIEAARKIALDVFGSDAAATVFGVYDRFDEEFEDILVDAFKKSFELAKAAFGNDATPATAFEIFDRYVGEGEDDEDDDE
jgi:hypothetical protein